MYIYHNLRKCLCVYIYKYYVYAVYPNLAIEQGHHLVLVSGDFLAAATGYGTEAIHPDIFRYLAGVPSQAESSRYQCAESSRKKKRCHAIFNGQKGAGTVWFSVPAGQGSKTACWFTPSSHIRLAAVFFSHDFSYLSVFSKEHVLQVTVPLTKLLSFTGSNWWIKKWRFPNPTCWSVSVSKSHFIV